MSEKERILIVSAHAVDFVWRAGGTIAQYAGNGNLVSIIDLSLGQRGESDTLWKQNPHITEEEVKRIRHKEAETAAKILGAQISFLDLDDHPLLLDRKAILQLASNIREYQPHIILTHSQYDPLNPDHDFVHQATLTASRSANVWGTFPVQPPVQQAKIFTFEPDQPDISHFTPDTIIDITDVWDIKLAAMKQIPTQAFMVDSYSLRTRYRGFLASRMCKGVEFAEAFVRLTPYVGKFFN